LLREIDVAEGNGKTIAPAIPFVHTSVVQLILGTALLVRSYVEQGLVK
jgi:hypothetical protein